MAEIGVLKKSFVPLLFFRNKPDTSFPTGGGDGASPMGWLKLDNLL